MLKNPTHESASTHHAGVESSHSSDPTSPDHCPPDHHSMQSDSQAPSNDSRAPSNVAPGSRLHEPTSKPLQSSTSSSTASPASGSRLWGKAVMVAVVIVGLVAAVGAVVSRSMPDTITGATLTHTMTRGDLIVSVTEQGTLESSNNVEVRSKVWGWKTVNWVIESGAIVKKGDLLVELDASEMEKKVEDARINYHNAKADWITAKSTAEVAEKSIDEYIKGTYVEERTTILQEKFDAEQAVTQAELAYKSTLRLAAKGLVEQIQVDGDKFKLESAIKKAQLKDTRLAALQEFKFVKQKEKLESDYEAALARLDAAQARIDLAEVNVRQHEEQLAYHTIRAPQDGMVIHPKAAAHRAGPDVEEGANVHTNQVLLIMPDLSQMQVKLGIHESMIDRVKVGLPAQVTVGGQVLDGVVSDVAEVTKPATWYTGNVVKFDTVVSIEGAEGLKPGLSAEVEVIIAEHEDVLQIPVAAIVENGNDHYCWVKTDDGPPQRRAIQLGDNNELFVVVTSGLKEGDEVVLNPTALLDEAQEEVMKPAQSGHQDAADSNHTPKAQETAASRGSNAVADGEKTPSVSETRKPAAGRSPKLNTNAGAGKRRGEPSASPSAGNAPVRSQNRAKN